MDFDKDKLKGLLNLYGKENAKSPVVLNTFLNEQVLAMHHGLTEEEINNHKTTVTLKS